METMNTMEAKDVLADIPTEGEETPDFGDAEKDTPTTTPVEKEPVVEEPSQEGETEPLTPENTPAAEDEDYKPRTEKRVQQLLKERSEERALREAAEAELAKFRQPQPEAVESIPERFVKLFGDDPETWKEYKAMRDEEQSEAIAKAVAAIKDEEHKTTQEQEEYVERYDGLMDELEADGKKFDRNELMKFITARPIFRQDGNPDFATALELMEAKKPKADLKARKELASIKPQGSIGAKGYATPDDLRGGWGSI